MPDYLKMRQLYVEALYELGQRGINPPLQKKMMEVLHPKKKMRQQYPLVVRKLPPRNTP